MTRSTPRGEPLQTLHDDDASAADPLTALRDDLERMNHAVLDEELERRILAEVRHQARSHPDFRAWLRRLPRARDGVRSIVVEALVAEPAGFEALLLDELDEALASADRAPDPRDELFPFSELGELPRSAVRTQVRDRALARLTSPIVPIRCWATDLLSDLVDPEDTDVLLRLRTLLEADLDWHVRDAAYRALTQLDALPPGFRPRLLDRLRARWLRAG